LRLLQDAFWKHAWKADTVNSQSLTDQNLTSAATIALPTTSEEPNNNNSSIEKEMAMNIQAPVAIPRTIRRYRYSNKPRKNMRPRTWRSRKDPFQEVRNKIRVQLELNPERTAKSLLDDLINEQPEHFNINLLRTLQRRVAEWRQEQIKIKQEKNNQKNLNRHDAINTYVSLIGQAVVNR